MPKFFILRLRFASMTYRSVCLLEAEPFESEAEPIEKRIIFSPSKILMVSCDFLPFSITDLLSTPCMQKAEAKEAEPMSVDSEA